jgi:type III pantothenate kinase
MDINVLVLNVGNTRLAAGVFCAGELRKVIRVPHQDKSEWSRLLGECWGLIESTDLPAVAGASVNNTAMEPLEHVVEQLTGKRVQWVGREIDLPIPVLTDKPEETGIDRILNVAAAYEQMQKACVVVDAGSAITVDVCNDGGEFIGGAIAPGLSMMLDALHERTSRLPRVPFEVPKGPFGKNTADAIRHGCYYGLRGTVKEVVENYATALGFWPDIIATGGDAELLFRDWELVHAVVPDLTLYGVAHAFTEHHIRHGT